MNEILGTLFANLARLLGIAAVVGILYVVFASNKTTDAITDTTQLQTNVQGLYSGQATFTSLTNAVAIAGKLAPKNMISGSNLVNPWGGAVTVRVNTTNAGRFDVVHAASIPQDACPKLVQSQSSAVGVSINGTAQTLPLDVGTATGACNVAENAVTFTFAH